MSGVASGFQGFEEPLDAGPPAANPKCPEHQYPSCPLPEYVLKIPPKKSAAPAKPPPGAPPPAECAVSLEFLRSFLRRLPGGASSSATMAKVVEDLVRPSTGATQSSYASQHFLVPRGHTGPPTWVVVHPWDMPAAELVAALEEFAAGLPPASTYFWIDALAVSQHLLRPGTGPNMAATAQAVAAATAAAAAAHRHATQADAAAAGDGGTGEGGGTASGGDGTKLQREPSFSSRMRMQQQAQAAVQELAVEAARREVLGETRAALAAARCGVLLVVGREARPLRRGWCLLQLAETLRARGPEAITLLPLEKGFKRADLVRQLRELDVAAVVAAAESWDQGVLAEVLGVPRPPAPGSAAALAAAAARASAANAAAAAASAAAEGAVGMRRAPSMKRSGSLAPGRSLAPSPGAGAGDELQEPADGCAAGRALARQLQLALLLRPMDGVLPARIMGAPLPDANPAVYCPTSPDHAAPGPGPSSTLSSGPQPGSSSNSNSSSSHSNSSQPWAFDWLWDWSAVASWLALPPHHPNAGCLLVTGPVGSGKTTALATLMAKGEGQGRGTGPGGAGPWVSASHFCSAADVRSLAVGEVVRSLAYQLACRSPCFGAALVRCLLGLGGPGGGAALVPDAWLHGAEEVVEALLRRPLEQEAEARAARGERPPQYVFLIDGLDEGPTAASVAANGSGSSSSSRVATPAQPAPPLPPPEPNSYDVLRLVVEHLRQLPNVRLILSCTAAADALEAAPDVAGQSAAASTPAAAPGGAGPASLPAPLIVASRGAVGAAASVHLAARRLLQPTEVPLAALRRDKYLALALAHVLQEFVLSPELTARELLWAARGCLAHVHILTLLVRHAAERLEAAGGGAGGRAPGMADPTAAAAALVTVAEASEARKAAEEEKAAAAATAAGVAEVRAGGKDGEELPQRPSTPPPQAPQPVPQRERSQAAGPAEIAVVSPGLPPHAEPGSSPVHIDSPHDEDNPLGLEQEPSQDGPLGHASHSSPRGVGWEASESSSGGRSPSPPALRPPPPLEPPPEPPVDVSGLRVPNTGTGAVSVHAVPPVCRGSLADEYGVLWAVRTDELRQSALLALLHAAAAAEREAAAREAADAAAAAAAAVAAAGVADGKGPADSPMQTPRTMAAVTNVAAGLAGGGGGGGPPKLVRAVSMTLAAHRKGSFTLAALAAAPSAPQVQPPERAARLQLLVDILAAAREPLEWGILARALQAAEPPPPEAAAAAAGPAAAAAAGAARAAAVAAAAAGAGRRGGGFGALGRELGVIVEGDTPRSSLTGGGFTPRSSGLGGLPRRSGAGALAGAPDARLSTNGFSMGSRQSPGPPSRATRLSHLGEPAATAVFVASHDGGVEDDAGLHGDSADEDEEEEQLGHLDSSDWEEDTEWDSVFNRLGAGASAWQDDKGDGPSTEAARAAASREAARAAAVLRDLDWALSEEGPLSSLVFVSGSGKVCVRHSSFLEWLRRGSSALIATSNPALTAAASTLVLSTPRPHVGHAALARVLRSQMPSGRAAAAAAAAAAATAAAAAAAAPAPPSRGGAHAGHAAAPGGAAGSGKPGSSVGHGAGAAAVHPLGSSQGAGPGHNWGGGGPAGWPSSVGCSGYVLRQVVPHCVEGRLPSSEIEGVVMDLEWVRLLLEGGHVEVVAGAIEHMLRTRGPDAAGGAGAGGAAAAAWSALGGAGGASNAGAGGTAGNGANGGMPALGMLGSSSGHGQLSMRGASNLGMGTRGVGSSFRDALVGGSGGGGGLSPRGAAGAVGTGGAAGGASFTQAGLQAAALCTPPPGAHRGGGGAAPGDGRRLSTAASALLRDLLRWLATDGLRLWRRPEPLAIACSASLAPMGSPFRRRAEQLTAATVAAAAALAVSAFTGSLPGAAGGSHTGTPTKTPPVGGVAAGASAGSGTRPPAGGATAAARALGASASNGSGGGGSHHHTGAAASAEGTAATPAAAALAPWPPSHVTALPHPRLWKPEQRRAQCSHRVSALLPSPDGDVMLAAGEWASKATLLDVLTGRRLALLDAGPDSHSTALSAAAFSPDRRLVASAGLAAGSVTLWDAATGTPKACLPLRGNVGDFFGIAGCAAYACTAPNTASGAVSGSAAAAAAVRGASENTPAAAAAANAAEAEAAAQRVVRRMKSMALAFRMGGDDGDGDDGGRSPLLFDDDGEPWVAAIAIHAPGPGASAASYGAPAGTPVVATVAEAAEAAAAAGPPTSGKPRRVGAIVAGSLLLAAGDSETGKVVLWAVPPEGLGAVRTGLVVPPPPPGGDTGGVASLEFVPGGRTLAVVQSCSTAIRLYSVQSQQLVQTLRLPASCGEVLGIRFAPQPVHLPPPPNAPADWAPPPPGAGGAYSSYGASHGPGGGSGGETLLSAACFTSTQLWSLERRAQVVSLPIGAGADGGRAWATNCVAFSPACGLIATAGALFAAAVKAIAQGNSFQAGGGASSGGGAGPAAADGAGFHEADAATVALIEAAAAAVRSIDRSAVTLWDVRTGGKVATLRGLAGTVRALAFNPDGGILAVAAGPAVSLWSATTGSCLAVIHLGEEGSGAEVSAVAFGRGGAILSASMGVEVHSWDVALVVAAAAAVAAEAVRTSVFGAPPPGRSSLFGGSSLTPRSRMGTSNGTGVAPHLNAPSTPNAAAAQLVTAATSGQPAAAAVPPPLQNRASQLGLAGASGAANSGGTSSGAATGRFAGAVGCVGGGGHTDRVTCACFSPNGSLALTGGFDNTVRMWDVKRHVELQAVETPGAALGVAWSPDSSLVAASLSNGSAIVWYVVTAAMAPSTFGAAAGGGGGGGGANVTFGSHEAARFQCSDGAFGVCSIAFTADGSVVATAVGDGSMNLWCTKTWKRLLQVVPEARGGGVALGRYGGAAQTLDGGWVLLGCGREVAVYSVAAGREATERLGPHGSLVNALALSPCGRFVAVAAGGAISVWGRPPSTSGGAEHGSAAAGRATKVHRPAPAGAGSAGNSHSGEAAAAENGAVRAATPSSPPGRSSPAATPPAPLFEPRVAYLSGLGSDVLVLAFSHDGAMLAAGHADGSVRVWASGSKWREVGWLAGHGDCVAGLAFSPDGRLLLSGGWDGRTLCWSMRDALMPRSSWSAMS